MHLVVVEPPFPHPAAGGLDREAEGAFAVGLCGAGLGSLARLAHENEGEKQPCGEGRQEGEHLVRQLTGDRPSGACRKHWFSRQRHHFVVRGGGGGEAEVMPVRRAAGSQIAARQSAHRVCFGAESLSEVIAAQRGRAFVRQNHSPGAHQSHVVLGRRLFQRWSQIQIEDQLLFLWPGLWPDEKEPSAHCPHPCALPSRRGRRLAPQGRGFRALHGRKVGAGQHRRADHRRLAYGERRFNGVQGPLGRRGQAIASGVQASTGQGDGGVGVGGDHIRLGLQHGRRGRPCRRVHHLEGCQPGITDEDEQGAKERGAPDRGQHARGGAQGLIPRRVDSPLRPLGQAFSPRRRIPDRESKREPLGVSRLQGR